MRGNRLHILLLLLLVVIVTVLAAKVSRNANVSPKWYNHICYGVVLSVSEDDLVIDRDSKTQGDQTTFTVKHQTNVYGMKGMTEVPLSEIVPGMHVRIVYRETMRPKVGIAREVKVIIQN